MLERGRPQGVALGYDESALQAWRRPSTERQRRAWLSPGQRLGWGASFPQRQRRARIEPGATPREQADDARQRKPEGAFYFPNSSSATIWAVRPGPPGVGYGRAFNRRPSRRRRRGDLLDTIRSAI